MARKPAKTPKTVETIKHEDATRKNIPTANPPDRGSSILVFELPDRRDRR